jgi:hypothetical protein
MGVLRGFWRRREINIEEKYGCFKWKRGIVGDTRSLTSFIDG